MDYPDDDPSFNPSSIYSPFWMVNSKVSMG
jgi:hypothetical protein